MAGKWWEAAPVVETQQPQQQGGGVFVPDQGAIDDARREETRTDISLQSNERAEGGQEFTQAQGLRKEFDALPDVKNYREAVTALDTGLFTKPDGSGDGTLLYQYSKLMDPMGSVREGDVQLAQSGAGYLSAKAAQLKKDFGVGSGGTLPPEIREGLRREMISRFNSLNRAYSQQRQRYGQLAQESNYSPDSIIGEHAGAPFLERFRAYDRAHGLGDNQPDGQSQDGRGPIPGATPDNISFDIDTGTGAFGSEITAGRLSEPQQAALTAFLKANSGNPNFGPEQLDAFYKSIGVQGAAPGNDAFFDAVRTGQAFTTKPDYTASDEARRQWAEDQVRQRLDGEELSPRAIRDKGATLNLSDELYGVRGGLEAMLRGDNLMEGYRDARDVERAEQRMARDKYGLADELIPSLMLPAGMLSKANIARDAAGMAAIAGFGEGEGPVDSLAKAGTGAALGYGAGKALEAAAPVVANSRVGQRFTQMGERRADRQAERQAFADAADRQGLDYMAADIPGSRLTQFATSVTRATLGGVPLAEQAAKTVQKAKAARDRIAGAIGEAGDNVAAGQAAQRGIEAWERKTAGRGGELYDAIPIKPDTMVDLSATRQTLADMNGNISSNDELAALVRDPKMLAYQRALESGDLSWKDIKSFRSYIGEKAGRPTLQQDTSKDSLDALYGALSKDIERAAQAHSPEAAKAFGRANNYWRGRQQRLDDVMTKLVGKDRSMSPEATFKQVERWADVKGGDYGKLARTIRSLPEDEASTVRATIIDRLGDANPGQQGAANDNFSPDTFLTQWARLSDRAKGILFQGEHRKALDDLAQVFEGTKFSRGFDNTSKTSIGTNIGVLGALGTVEPVSALALAALQGVGGKVLASPRFARWMVALAKKPNVSAQLAHVNQLTAIARAEPIIANDIFTIQERLAKAFAQPSALRSAAEEDNELGKPPPAQGERGNAQ